MWNLIWDGGMLLWGIVMGVGNSICIGLCIELGLIVYILGYLLG